VHVPPAPFGWPHFQTPGSPIPQPTRRCDPSGVTVSLRQYLARPHGGLAEIGGLAVLYGLYEVVRGVGGENWRAALANTADIVALEQRLSVYGERAIQEWVQSVPALPSLLGLAYIVLHFGATALALVWVHRSHRASFPVVRTTLIVSTALALVGYVMYPAAPPRLANLGFADTVTEHAGLNLSSDLLGSLYNPIAAVPSLHFGYALLVGVAVFALARNRFARTIGALYPAVMLFIIVATGNHFWFDAAAGGVVMVAGWLIAWALSRPAAERRAVHRALAD
jgi:PAP2 superfamily